MDSLERLFSKTLDPRAHALLRARMEELRVQRTNRMRRAEARVLQLEEDLARVALLARTLTELCLAKGVLTKQELAEQLVATDIVDGALDFGLDPSLTLPGEERLREDLPQVAVPARKPVRAKPAAPEATARRPKAKAVRKRKR